MASSRRKRPRLDRADAASVQTSGGRIETESQPAEPPRPPKPSRLRLSPTAEKNLIKLLETSHQRAMSDLEPHRERVKLWRDLYEGQLKPKWKPHKDGSEVFFPLPALIADTAKARIFQTIFQQKDVAALESPMQDSDYETITGESLKDALSAGRRFLNHVCLDPSELDLKSAVDSTASEITQVGTAPVRVYYDFQLAPKRKVRAADGSIDTRVNAPIRDRIRIEVIPNEQCFWDTTADKPSSTRFIGYEMTYSRTELKALARAQGWPDDSLNAILAAPDTQPSPAQSDAASRDPMDSGMATEDIRRADGSIVNVSLFAGYSLREVWIPNTDIDDDGALEDVRVMWHERSRTAIADYFPYAHNEVPVTLLHYEQRRNRNIGMPSIAGNESMFAGANAIVNQTIDAQSFRNCPSMAGPETSDTLHNVEEEGMYLGRIFYETEPGEVRYMEFSGAGNTVVSLNVLGTVVDMVFRKAHLGPAQFGEVEAAQRIPTDIGTAIMSEGAQLLDKVINRFRVGMSTILHQALSLYRQYQPHKFAAILGPDDARKLERLFTVVGLDKLRVSLNVTSSTSSRELDRANLIALGQQIGTFAREATQYAQVITGGVDPKTGQPLPPNPVAASAAAKTLTALQNIAMDAAETYPSVTDGSRYVPDIASDFEAAAAQTGGGTLAGEPPVGGVGTVTPFPSPGIGPGSGLLGA